MRISLFLPINLILNQSPTAIRCFSHSKIELKHPKSEDLYNDNPLKDNRRTFLSAIIAPAFALLHQPQISLATITTESQTSSAALFSPDLKLSKEDAKKRFKNAQTDLKYLLDNYSSISEVGGDNVRRYLGTVGTTSNLYGIRKVMKTLQEEADDIVEYTETMNDFDASLVGADQACYSANFVEFSSAKTKPEQFFKDAKNEVKRMITYMDAMAKELNL